MAAPTGEGQPREAGQSLDAYASSERRTAHCWVCNIPEKEELARFFLANGPRYATMARWLQRERGYASNVATKPKLSYHFAEARHHEAS